MNGCAYETVGFKTACLIVLLTSPLSADVMHFHVARPWDPLRGILPKVGTGSFVGEGAPDAEIVTVPRLVSCDTATFHGVFVLRNLDGERLGQGAFISSRPNGGIRIHAAAAYSLPTAVPWFHSDGGERLTSLWPFYNTAIPITGVSIEDCGRTPLFVLVSCRDDVPTDARWFPRPAFQFQDVPCEAVRVPEPSGLTWLLVCGGAWRPLRRCLR